MSDDEIFSEVLLWKGLGDNLYKELAENRKLFILGEITKSSATHLIAHLLWCDRQNSDEITIYINSTGGDIVGGLFSIHDCMVNLKSPVKTICIGEAFSAAAFILSAGTKGLRFAYPNSYIMVHGVQCSNLSGTQEEIEREQKQNKHINKILVEKLSSYTGKAANKIKRDLKEDKYYTAEQALEYGIIDAILR